jgi:hypothetical protein
MPVEGRCIVKLNGHLLFVFDAPPNGKEGNADMIATIPDLPEGWHTLSAHLESPEQQQQQQQQQQQRRSIEDDSSSYIFSSEVMFNVVHGSHWHTPHALWDCQPAVPSMCDRKQQQQQQQQQRCDCILGVCICPRGLIHDDSPLKNTSADHPPPCSIDPSSTSSFLPSVHPLLSKSRCVRTQRYVEAKQQVIPPSALLLRRFWR